MDAIGWRPDPEDDAFERWWDGVAWTSHTRPARDAEPEAQEAPRLGLRRAIQREPLTFAPDERTRVIGWIVGSPFWAGSVLVVVSIVQDVGMAATLAALVIAILCLLDRRALRRRGFTRLPSRWWVLLGAVGYLAGRRRALDEHDAASLVICAVGWCVVAVPIFVYTAVRVGLGAAAGG